MATFSVGDPGHTDEHNRQPLNAGYFGVVADGATDDTTAWVSAVSAASTVGLPLVAPPGVSITSGFDLPAGFTLQGHRMGSTLKLKAASTRSVIGIVAATTQGVTVRNLTIDGNKANQTNDACHGILLDNQDTALSGLAGYTADAHHLIEDVHVTSCEGSGVVVTGRGDTHFVRVKSYLNDLNGFDIDGFDLWFTDCIAGSNGEHGFVNVSGNNTFTGCKAFLSGLNDWQIGPQSYYGRYLGCISQGAYGNGFHLDTGSRGNLLDVTVLDADYGAAGLTSAVLLTAAPRNIVNVAVAVTLGTPTPVYGVNFASESAGCRVCVVGLADDFSGGLVGGTTTNSVVNPT
jgi:hypothetical protein